MSDFKYSQTWFIGSEIHNKLLQFIDSTKVNNVLEIGCFEGLSSVFFAQHLLNHPESTLTCVDPFLNVENNDHKEFLMNNEELNFDHNISICKNSNKITVLKITSDSFFEQNKKTYNFIYIDGCHKPDYVTRDMENAFKVLNKNGIMWMDDYRPLKDAMNKVLVSFEGQYELIHSGYQLAIRKL